MRLEILNKGYRLGARIIFSLVRLASGHPLPDAATAARAFNDGAKVAAVLSDLETASIGEPLKSTLRMLGKLTKRQNVTGDDMHSLLAIGASRAQIEDALAVFFAFNTTDRLADAFGFELLSEEAFAAGAKVLLVRGYR